MTWIINSVETFVDEALEGFVAVHADAVRRVDGGVVRRRSIRDGQVAVIVGGGSGHYPAFAGLVGEGFAAGAVCGNVFSSPSSAQARRVAEEAERDGGVLFLYGNYAGDVLHFGRAQESLRAIGIDTRTVLVTDDIASAGVNERERRRGVAGDLVVFKVAAASAERGDTLDEVERLAAHANDRTRTLGVAFDGCRLPGASDPLFTVPEGSMSIGLGIHGEPGLSEQPIPSADSLAELFVSGLLDELPQGISSPEGQRATVIVNGLGTVKYEELFVLYGAVARRLAAAGVTIVAPESGELVTSLDMAGASVTICWLDPELEALWVAPSSAPGYTRGARDAVPGDDASDVDTRTRRRAVAQAHVGDSAELRALAPRVVSLLDAARAELVAHERELGELDSVAGDGDHGVGMVRGISAALDAARDAESAGAGAARILVHAGEAWSDRAGGTSGALWGAALAAAGASLGAHDPLDDESVVAAVQAAFAAVTRLGGARPGDKTMMDAFAPFVEELGDPFRSDRPLTERWTAAAQIARSAAVDTAELRPKLGRARPLAEKSIGHPDPGAVSFGMIVTAVAPATNEGVDA